MAILNRIMPNESKNLNQEDDFCAMDAVHSKHHRMGAAVVPLEKHKSKGKLFLFALLTQRLC